MKIIARFLYCVPAMVLMIMIFYLSSQEAVASTETSTRLGRGIIFIKSSILDEELSAEEIEKQALYIDHAVRKTAHATEYMFLGLFVYLGIMKSGIYDLIIRINPRFFNIHKKLKEVLIMWILATLYACLDEIHQVFVPGRSGQISDVIIDSLGALCGCLIYIAIAKLGKTLRE